MITVNVYTHGGNVFCGQMTELEALDLVELWGSRKWKNPVLILGMKDEEYSSIAYVMYSQITAIDYMLGL